MSAVLVTGGAGFIGSHIAEAYLAAGHEVVVIDNLSRGKRKNIPFGVEFIQADIRDPMVVELIRERRFEIINHHAAQVDVRVSVADPRLDASINLDGLLNLLEAARRYGVRRFIFVSSGGVVYGEPEVMPTPETAPKLPASPYGVTKLTGEQYLYYYHRVHGLDYAAVRYSNVYGPRQDPHGEAGVVAIFSTRLLDGAPVVVFGDGEQTRDYVSVRDVVAANMLLSDAELRPARLLDDRAFNVGTGVETSVNELAAALGRVSEKTPEIRREPARDGELLRSSLDASKLRRLGWVPAMELDRGLRETFQWIAEQ
ncbi:MAG: NAD-dependent epimerase/dehydratase family protein [Gemmatimonadota bacterium]|jgi:UDP-glucose 4-epimerase|nr:NAD-dependent epimerase/dehydratase family protein [Gemmatimonadota bacterium]